MGNLQYNDIKKIPKTNGYISYKKNMATLTWLKAGGIADIFFIPADILDLKSFLTKLNFNIPIFILGAGSNTLFRDNGFKGIVIKLGKNFDYYNIIDDKNICVGAATNCIKLSRVLAKEGISGLEFFSGIPGTVGGAIKMNAGAYGNDTSQYISKIKVINRRGEVKVIEAKDYEMNYRETNFPNDYIFLEAYFNYHKRSPDINLNNIKNLNNIRKKTQPIKEKTSGSTFRNTENNKAWKLIQESGCKRYSVGQAAISDLHSNFIVNKGGASSNEIEELGEKVIKKVYDKFGIKLIWEIKIIGNK
ncbi:MAG: UDP-N-acetylenolpyruvoylglucosamine reductase [Rickettsiales bacterium]|nr:UDP-N-acetylenolpyruvoylglucosamine reductase [Rickettsiales bacterium]